MLPGGEEEGGVDAATQGQPGISVPPRTPTLALLGELAKSLPSHHRRLERKENFAYGKAECTSPHAPRCLQTLSSRMVQCSGWRTGHPDTSAAAELEHR